MRGVQAGVGKEGVDLESSGLGLAVPLDGVHLTGDVGVDALNRLIEGVGVEAHEYVGLLALKEVALQGPVEAEVGFVVEASDEPRFKEEQGQLGVSVDETERGSTGRELLGVASYFWGISMRGWARLEMFWSSTHTPKGTLRSILW